MESLTLASRWPDWLHTNVPLLQLLSLPMRWLPAGNGTVCPALLQHTRNGRGGLSALRGCVCRISVERGCWVGPTGR